jgi:hypothetical protein
VLRSDNEYTQEYERFVSGVSYAAPEQTPGFTEAVDVLRAPDRDIGDIYGGLALEPASET